MLSNKPSKSLGQDWARVKVPHVSRFQHIVINIHISSIKQPVSRSILSEPRPNSYPSLYLLEGGFSRDKHPPSHILLN